MQKEIAQLEVTGESGAGLVKIAINGAHNCRRVEIDLSLLEDDKDMLEDLIAAAFNDAARRIAETQKEKEKWPLSPATCSFILVLKCHSDANQFITEDIDEGLALPSGRWAEIGAVYGFPSVAE